tara:strand:- start:13449 stop:13739 length:291 start_codon:yes stop_codon:yes gene_type:complete
MLTDNSITQLHGISPEEFFKSLSNILKSEIQALKKDFQPKEPPKYYTRKEVAQMLQVNLSTLHTWAKEGRLTPYGIGGRVYYLRTDIEKAIVKLNQ